MSRANRVIALFAAIFIISILAFVPAYAADVRTGQNINVAAGEVVNDDLYLAGSDITINGTVTGDVVAAGNRVVINGDVGGSVIIMSGTVTINGHVGNSVRAGVASIEINNKVNNDVVVLGGTVEITSAGSVGRDLLANAGVVTVDATVARNILCNGNRLVIGNTVGGNVQANVTELRLETTANIAGDLNYTSVNEASIASGAVIHGLTKHIVPEQTQPPSISGQAIAAALGAIASAVVAFLLALVIIITIIQFAAALLTGIVVILLAGKQASGVIATLRSQPWPCLGWGALITVLTPIAAGVLFATIIGIPVALAGMALYLIALYLGHLVTAIFLGRWILRQPASENSAGHLIGALALGLLLVYVVGLIPGIGAISDLAVGLFGFGAIICYARDLATRKGS